jgi:hypothetical protein
VKAYVKRNKNDAISLYRGEAGAPLGGGLRGGATANNAVRSNQNAVMADFDNVHAALRRTAIAFYIRSTFKNPVGKRQHLKAGTRARHGHCGGLGAAVAGVAFRLCHLSRPP